MQDIQSREAAGVVANVRRRGPLQLIIEPSNLYSAVDGQSRPLLNQEATGDRPQLLYRGVLKPVESLDRSHQMQRHFSTVFAQQHHQCIGLRSCIWSLSSPEMASDRHTRASNINYRLSNDISLV